VSETGRDDGVSAEAGVETVDDRLQAQRVLAGAVQGDLLGGAGGVGELFGAEGEAADPGALQAECVEDGVGEGSQVLGVGGGLAQGAGALDPGAVGEGDVEGEGAGGLVAAQPVAEGDGRVQQFGAQPVGVEGAVVQEALLADADQQAGRPAGTTGRGSMPRARSCRVRPRRPPRMRCTVAGGVAARAPMVCRPKWVREPACLGPMPYSACTGSGLTKAAIACGSSGTRRIPPGPGRAEAIAARAGLGAIPICRSAPYRAIARARIRCASSYGARPK
jgi:hypothetical protein